MKSLRTFLGDRLSAGLGAALAGYLLVVQLFVAALTCGMTVPIEGAPQFVLCQPSLTIADRSSDDGPAFEHECPCVVCPATDASLSLALAPGVDLGPAFALAETGVAPVVDDPARRIDPSRLGLAPAPRGPPSLSA